MRPDKSGTNTFPIQKFIIRSFCSAPQKLPQPSLFSKMAFTYYIIFYVSLSIFQALCQQKRGPVEEEIPSLMVSISNLIFSPPNLRLFIPYSAVENNLSQLRSAVHIITFSKTAAKGITPGSADSRSRNKKANYFYYPRYSPPCTGQSHKRQSESNRTLRGYASIENGPATSRTIFQNSLRDNIIRNTSPFFDVKKARR